MKVKEKIVHTLMLKSYFVKLVIRVLIFSSVLLFYIRDKDLMYRFMNQPFWMGITPIHLLWLVFMAMMINHLFPTKRLSMAIRKSHGCEYEESAGYSELELFKFVQDQNLKAWKVMLCWLFLNGIFGALYVLKVIDNADLLMLSVFYFLCDYICILFYCPFQSLIMKNRCCVNCRIYEWGHFMMFTPMLFIKSFFSWSLFFTSCVVLINWELIYAKHPERFWSGSNKKLQCKNCQDKICKVKNKVVSNGM